MGCPKLVSMRFSRVHGVLTKVLQSSDRILKDVGKSLLITGLYLGFHGGSWRSTVWDVGFWH